MPDGIFSYQKYQFLVHFGRPWNINFWYNSLQFGMFMSIWYSLLPFGIFCAYIFGIFDPVLVFCIKKNLATLVRVGWQKKETRKNADEVNDTIAAGAGELSEYFQTRVARWRTFKPKIAIWVNFGGSCNGRYWSYWSAIWSILWPIGIFCGYLVHFYNLWLFVTFFLFGMLYQEKSGKPSFRTLLSFCFSLQHHAT
jgi:hypothetical protein